MVAIAQHLTDPDDPRLAEYAALNDPVERRRVERHGGYFIVEGLVAIERLMATPVWEVRSLVLLPRMAERLADRLADVDAPVLTADEDVLEQVVGFQFHRGALAAVTRIDPPTLDDRHLSDLVDRARRRSGGGERPLLLVLEGVGDHENLGALYRNAAALGAAAVLIDPTCAEPFYRRSIRVSSGLVLTTPTYRISSIAAAAELLKVGGVTVVALTPSGKVDLRQLDRRLGHDESVAIVVGAEGAGLTDSALGCADHRVRIEMADEVDSLNVATAAAIALHHLNPR